MFKHAGTMAISKNGAVYKDGVWRVFQSATQKNSDDLKTWKSRTVSSEVYDKVLEAAVAKSSEELIKFLTACDYDLFLIDDFKDEIEEVVDGEECPKLE